MKRNRSSQIRPHRHLLSDERGVFAPLFAVVSLGLFFILIILGIDTGRIKVAQSELRTKVDQICGELAWSPSSYLLNIRRFRDYLQQQVDEDVLEYGNIEDAKLIMPTMPVSGDFDFKAGQYYLPSDGTPSVNSISDISDFGVTSCTLEHNGNCKFQGTIFNDSNVPLPIQDNLIMAGNMVMCEVTARVGTFLLGRFLNDDEELVTVKSAFWTPIRGVNPVYNPANPQATSAGLTIAIGTQMYTSPWDGRFRFSSAGSFPLDAAFRNNYDPFYTVNRPSPSHQPFSAASGRIFPFKDASNNIPQLQSIAPISSTEFFFGATPNGIAASASVTQPSSQIDGDPSTQFYSIPFTAHASAERVSDREAMLTACMNPLVLVRNTFLSTIVELASRHGQLRNMTEVLHINPLHRALDMTFGGDNYIPNPPAIITPFGMDIAQPLYQIPYVFYNTGVNSAEYPEPSTGWPGAQLSINTYSKGGWINPFTNGGNPGSGWIPNPDNALASHHALVASQLRACYHLYSGGHNPTVSPSFVGVQRYGRFLDILANPGFYPNVAGLYPAPDSSEKWPAEIKELNYQADHYWDQCSPWGGADTGCIGANLNQSRSLTAAEVVSVLGTTQVCPYNQVDNSIFDPVRIHNDWEPDSTVRACPPTEVRNATSDPYAGDSTISSYELRPDVGAVLRYALGVANGGGGMPPPSAVDRVDAITSPGLFPITDNGLVEKPFLGIDSELDIPISPYQTARNELSTILLVLHQPLTREQIDDLKEVFEEYYRPQWQVSANDRRVGRPIIIAYFPSNEADASAAGGFDEIFSSAGDSLNVPNSATSPVTVMNFSPYDRVWGREPCGLIDDPEQPPVIPPGATESEIFRRYWQCLLSDSEVGIVAQSQRVFRERLTRKEAKL